MGKVAMLKPFLILCTVLAVASNYGAAQATVHVEPENLKGPRVLEDQTRTTVIRDYLQAWQGLHAALEQNRPDLLGADFVGTSKHKLLDPLRHHPAQGTH